MRPAQPVFVDADHMWPLSRLHKNMNNRLIESAPCMVQIGSKYYIATVVTPKLQGALVVLTRFLGIKELEANEAYWDLVSQYEMCHELYKEKYE